MPVLAVGYSFVLYSSVLLEAELSASLFGLEVSSSSLPSTVLNTPIVLDASKTVFTLPTGLIQGIYALYNYDTVRSCWNKIKSYSIHGNKLTLTQSYSGTLVAMPTDSLEDTFYRDGEYVYTMSLVRSDNRIYRNIVISSSSCKPSPYLSMLFSFDEYGPWKETINAQSLFSTFYVKVTVRHINDIDIAHTVPSEFITLSCLTCE